MSDRYKVSEALLERALKTIPLGSQTFSKSKTQYPAGISPYFITRGSGCRVWDVDGNEYIDFVSSLASVTLGYSDSDVNAAVRKQLEDGVIFSLPHPLEMEVAERLVEMVPCAEMVRFGKTGSAPIPRVIAWRYAATTAGRIGTSAPPPVTAVYRNACAILRTALHTTTLPHWSNCSKLTPANSPP
jgi:glutamate-1-semialdehyde 2,1-aminomutase